MENEVEAVTIAPPVISRIDPTEFDVTINALLIGLGAEKYIDIFRKHNIGQCTLMELTDEDLIKLGVKNAETRQKIMEEVKNLPIYEEASSQLPKTHANLGPIEIVEVLEESSQHLYRIYLSMLANSLAVKKTKRIADNLLHKDKYASDVALATLSEITSILNSMDITLHTQMKSLTKEPTRSSKKIVVGTVGGVVIVMLAVLFVKSLKQIK